MKRLELATVPAKNNRDYFAQTLDYTHSKKEFVGVAKDYLSHLKIEFYDFIGLILKHIGFVNPSVSRNGDTNCRMDAIIIDDENSIPIEIKSPGESVEINIKSIRQACENKVVILSRKFYATNYNTTSLAIAFGYPPERSDVYELINDIKNAYGFNIGIIDINDLLSLVYDVKKAHCQINFEYFNTFYGKFDYDKTLL